MTGKSGNYKYEINSATSKRYIRFRFSKDGKFIIESSNDKRFRGTKRGIVRHLPKPTSI
jgi:phage-related protein